MTNSKKEELRKDFEENVYLGTEFEWAINTIDHLIQDKVEKIEKCLDFADIRDALKSRIITILKE